MYTLNHREKKNLFLDHISLHPKFMAFAEIFKHKRTKQNILNPHYLRNHRSLDHLNHRSPSMAFSKLIIILLLHYLYLQFAVMLARPSVLNPSQLVRERTFRFGNEVAARLRHSSESVILFSRSSSRKG